MTFIPVTRGNDTVPVRELPVSGSWLKGSLLVMNGSGQWTECGADPASVGGVACGRVGTGSGALVPTGNYDIPAGFGQAFKVQNEVEFEAEYVGSLPANVGGSYGVVKGADGKWRVDFTETVNTVVKLVSIASTTSPLSRNRVTVVFLAAKVQIV